MCEGAGEGLTAAFIAEGDKGSRGSWGVMISFVLDKICPVGHICAANVCSYALWGERAHAHLPYPDDQNIFHPSSPCDGKMTVAMKCCNEIIKKLLQQSKKSLLENYPKLIAVRVLKESAGKFSEKNASMK